MEKRTKCPSGLKKPGRLFWKKVMSEFVLQDAHDLKRLEQACHCLDEIQQAEDVIEKEGHFIRDRFAQTKEHPAMKTVRDTRLLFLKTIRELGLDLQNPEPPRPPRQY